MQNGTQSQVKKGSLVPEGLEQVLDMRSVMDSLQANVMVANTSFELVYVNPLAVETLRGLEDQIIEAFGVRVDELLGGSIHRFHRDPKRVERILKNPRSFPHTTQFGFGTVTLRTHINSVYGPTGIEGYVVVWEDVSQQLRTEKERRRFEAMMEQAPTGVMMADLDFRIVYVNPASVRMLKKIEAHLPCRAEDVKGQVFDIFHKRPEHQRKLVGDPKNLPHRSTIQLGSESLDLLVSPIFGANHEYLGAMLTWDVITEQLAQQRAIREANEREQAQASQLREKVDQLLLSVSVASKGDLTQQVDVVGEDVVGRMGDGLSKLLRDLRGSIEQIGGTTGTLASSAEELRVVSQQMGGNAEETSAQANVVSSAAEEVSKNVETVATAAEELGASVREIANNAAEAARVAAQAVKAASSANTTIGKLGDSSVQIGKVIKVITSIAQQTNLLALNATIEAARAGEAGKGFAVVANEVKELARETANATEDIGQKIEAIQNDTRAAVSALGEITSIISQISEIQSTIASAVEEQSATTLEIGRNVAEASRGSGEIARNILSVAQAASDTTAGASQTQSAANDLARMAAQLQKLVSRFKY